MSNITIILDDASDWEAYYPTSNIVIAEDYLANHTALERGRLVINLCHSYKYLSHGYYCSLLAEARSQRVIPSIRTINDLSKKPLYGLDLDKINSELNKLMSRSAAGEKQIRIKIFFGHTQNEALQDFARQVFEQFPCPILEVDFSKTESWSVSAIRPVALNRLTEAEEDLFANSLDRFSQKLWRKPRSRKKYRYDLAILVDPNEALPPSDAKSLKNFVKAGRELGIDVDFIGKKDLVRLGEYDALFIRETTAINNHTYQFAKKAESEGMVVIDDPESILRCTNKVYLANLLAAHRVPTPKTVILSRHKKEEVAKLPETLAFPIVLKIPDGSFSLGVVKAGNEKELLQYTEEFFKKSALILAQEFYYTDYDWRIGVLNGKPLYACQYFMSKGHWQIYQHGDNGQYQTGNYVTVPVRSAPVHVVKNALKAANLIGNGLYGVDIKQRDEQSVVIEVNDNPNIDAGVEDDYLGEDLYRYIMSEFLRRLEQKRLGIVP